MYKITLLTILQFFLIVACTAKPESEIVLPLPGIFNTQQYVPSLQNKRVALVANNASEMNQVHLLDTLLALGVNVTKVFAPEHGFKGNIDAGATVENSLTANNIEVISLYGSNYKPKGEDLQEVDVIVFDLQDVGVRFYTYISTLHYVMEACAGNSIPLIVLDRPNPNAHYVDGPVRDEKYKGMVAMHPVPIVYGLTIGEYATMINGEGWLNSHDTCNLTVIPCTNYTHTTFYELPAAPSPNLPDMETVLLYPPMCFFEGTIMSEGRGTRTPFKVIGHPDFPDTTFSFTPVAIKGMSMYPKLKGEKCYGYDLRNLTVDSLYLRTQLDLSLLINAYTTMNIGEAFFIPYFENLVGTKDLRNAIMAGKSEKEIHHSWKPEIIAYKKIREKYLIYP